MNGKRQESSSSPPASSDSPSLPASPPPSSSVAPSTSNAPPSTPTPPPPSSSIVGSTSSSVPPSSSTPVQVATITLTSIVSTTNANGETIIETVQSTSTTAASNPSSLNHTSNSHVAAIAGGAVGGAAALLLLLLLGWFLARRRRRSDFDGDFDPDNVGTIRHGRQTLVPEGPTGAEVTPYTLHNGPANGGPHMEEYNAAGTGAAAGLGAGVLAGAAMHHSRTPSNHRSASSQSEYPQTESSYLPNPYGSHYGQNPHDLSAIAPLPGSASERSHPSSSQPRSAKEREAYAQRYGTSSNATGSGGGLHLATGSPVDDDASSHVVVHQDGGRVRPEHQSPSEIPPTYDSLPSDERS